MSLPIQRDPTKREKGGFLFGGIVVNLYEYRRTPTDVNLCPECSIL